jgi:glycosyltransferase involved in cell wall biosynthesis
MPLVSVVMPVYNAGRFVEQSISSILGQTMSDLELIVVDDGSSDNSWDAIHAIQDPRLIVMRNPSNKGIVYSRNKGLSHSRGEYYAPFDADDMAFPDKLSRQVRFLNENPGVGLVGSWAKWIDQEGNLLPGGWKLKAAPDQIRVRLLFHNYFVHSSVLIRKKLMPVSGYKEGFDRVEDYRLWADLFPQTVAWNLQEYLMAYRWRTNAAQNEGTAGNSASDIAVIMLLLENFGITIPSADARLLLRLRDKNPGFNIQEKKRMINLFSVIWKTNSKAGYLSKSSLLPVLFNRFLKSMMR